MTRFDIKSRAKEQLGGKIFSSNWMLALVVCLLVNAIQGVLGAIPTVGGILAVLLLGPIAFGQAYCFLKQARDRKEMEVKDLFVGFNNGQFAQLLLLGIMQDLFIALWSLLLVVPGIVKMYAYSMAYYVKADHPEYKWKDCLDESQRLMQGHKADLFILDLSFIGWFIVGALCLGIGTLWVSPYLEASKAQFYLSLTDPEYKSEPEQTV